MQTKIGGFHFIEIILTLFLIALLATLSIPSFRSFYLESQNNSLQDQLYNALQLTRTFAIARHETIIFCASNDLKNCSPHWNTNWIIKNDSEVLQIIQPLQKVKLNWRFFPHGANQVVFLSNGTSEVETGSFWICAGNKKWSVIINKVGRIRKEIESTES